MTPEELPTSDKKTDDEIPPGLFTACLIHELNNPLSIIQTTTEQLLDGSKSEASLSLDLLQGGYKKILSQLEKIRHILGLGRLIASETVTLEFCPVEVNSVVLSARELVQDQLQVKSFHLNCDLAPNLPPIVAHPYFLEAALINLIANASDALQGKEYAATSEEKPHIIIQTRQVVHDGQIRVLITVADNGKGIPDTILAKLFTPFVSAKFFGQGNGLGLHIVKNIVEKCQGCISVETYADSGTMISLSFPCSKE